MDRQTFLDNFATIADAPGGPGRLRSTILDLALRGRLTSPCPSDGIASAEIEAGEQELLRHLERGEVQRPAAPNPIEFAPHDIPSGWRWIPLGDLVAVLDFRRKPIKKADRLARIAGKQASELYPYFGATQQAGLINDYLFDEELVLLGEDGAPFLTEGKHVAYLANGRYWVNNHAHVLRGLAVRNRYLVNALNQVDYAESVSGTTRLKLTQGKMIHLPIPVPPLAEQDRIVAKVDELMILCDELETGQERRHRATTRFRGSALHALTTSETPDDLRHAWERVSTNWPTVTSHSDSTQTIRNAVLELSMQGRLLAQRPGHRSMPALLASLGRASAPSPPGEIAPQQWAWATLDTILAAPLANGRSVPTRDSGSPVLRLTCLKHGTVDLSERKGGDWTAEQAEPFRVRKGDFLVARGNGSLSLVARGGLVSVTPDRVAFPDTLIRVQVDPELLAPELLRWWWNSPLVRRQVEPMARTTSGLYKVSQQLIGSVRLPVPPPDEQSLIVVALEAFMARCDGLESALVRQSRTEEALSGAITHQMGGTLTG